MKKPLNLHFYWLVSVLTFAVFSMWATMTSPVHANDLTPTFFSAENRNILSNINNQYASITPVYPDVVAGTTINPIIEAVIVTTSDIIISGNMIVDGRDWDPDLEIVIGEGIKGIQFPNFIRQRGNAKIGGLGIAPVRYATPPVIDPQGTSRLKTPEEVLGLAPGSLDHLITSTLPDFPFNDEIVYLSLPPGGSINNVDFHGSNGIFICHNASFNAMIKNFKGDFRGLIITDKLVRLNTNATIYGLIYTLSDLPGSNYLGNGKVKIRYSSKVINNVVNSVQINH